MYRMYRISMIRGGNPVHPVNPVKLYRFCREGEYQQYQTAAVVQKGGEKHGAG